MLDLVLVGDSFAIGALAWRLLQRRPEIAFAVLGQRTRWADRTWSFRGKDVTAAQLEWLWILGSASWPSFDVISSTATRRVGGGFHFIRGDELERKLTERLGDRLRRGVEVTAISEHAVTLSTGETIEAKAIIDDRSVAREGGLRVELTRLEVELGQPHGFEVPIGIDLRASPGVMTTIIPSGPSRVMVELQRLLSEAANERASLETIAQRHLAACGLQVAEVRSTQRHLESLGTSPSSLGSSHPFRTDQVADAVELADRLCEAPSIDRETIAAILDVHGTTRWNELRPVRAFAMAASTAGSLEPLNRLSDEQLLQLLRGRLSTGAQLGLLWAMRGAGLAEALRLRARA